MGFVIATLLIAFVVLVCAFRQYLRRTVNCPSQLRLDGKTVVVTGATGGIGREVALDCASRGAKVVLGCRSQIRAEATVAYIKSRTGNDDVHYVTVDMASLQSVKEFVDEFCKYHNKLDVLINNAAYMGPRRTTIDGYDQCMQVNFLAPFYMTNLFLLRYDIAGKTSAAATPSADSSSSSSHRRLDRLRVVNVSSDSYDRGRLNLDDVMMTSSAAASRAIYETYGDSKLAMMLFTMELNNRYSANGTTGLAAHPGPVRTGLLTNWPGLSGFLLRLMARLLFRDAHDGAQTVVYCAAVSDDVANELRGTLVADCQPRCVVPTVSGANGCNQATKLWDMASKFCYLQAH